MNISRIPLDVSPSKMDGRLDSANAEGLFTFFKGYLLTGDSAFISRALLNLKPEPKIEND